MYPGTHAATNPDKPAVILSDSGRILTYGELEDRSARLARALHDLGLRRGDVIGLLSDNRVEALEVYWAALRSGLYLTAVNHHLAPEEAAYVLDNCGAKALFVSTGVAPLATGIVGLTPAIEHRVAFGGDLDAHARYEGMITEAGPPLTDMPRGADMLYSSGTTGRPKGIKPPLLPIQANEPGDPFLALLAHAFGITADDVYLSAAPIYHAAPLRWCGGITALGGTVVLMERFSAASALSAIERYRVTKLQMVPTMFVRLLRLPADVREAADLSSLRMAIHAAAPCPPDVKQAMIDWWGPILTEYYASTEGNGGTMISSPQWLEKRGSVGKPILGVLHICDDEGTELKPGEVGTVYFEREFAPFEYHNDPAQTAASRHPQHPTWTTVGDLGYVDEDGFLFLTDRKAFMIITGGVNVYPQEIENVLTLHPAVLDVAVIGVPDAEFGEQVKAVVQLNPDVAGTPELAAEIIDYARAQIAHFKAPRSVDFVDDLPRTPTGKLIKGELKARYATAGAGG